jgi:hypothetical protein
MGGGHFGSSPWRRANTAVEGTADSSGDFQNRGGSFGPQPRPGVYGYADNAIGLNYGGYLGLTKAGASMVSRELGVDKNLAVI